MRPLPTAAVFLALALAGSVLAGSALAAAEAPAGTAAPPAVTYKDAAYVQVLFGAANAEDGLRLLGNAANGATEAVNLGGSEARRTAACAPAPPAGPAQPGAVPAAPPAPPPPDPCAERFFYLDVHDSFLFGGINTVELNISFLDQGFGPLYLDYDAIDPERPWRQDPALAQQRVELAQRGNTDAWKTVVRVLPDARFANGLGGADLRIGGPGAVTLRAVAVVKISTVLPPPPIRVLVDGRELAFTDAFPFIDQGRVLVPLRAIFEGVGASVQWEPVSRSIMATRGGRSVFLQVDSPAAFVGQTPVQLEVAPRLVNGRTFVPLRFAAESLGLAVSWDAANRTVVLVSPPPEPARAPVDIFNPPRR